MATMANAPDIARAAPKAWDDPMTAKRTRTVLVVDDDPDIRDVLAEILVHDGFLVEVASCGQEALERIAATGCDAVVSDIRMPGMNGMELFRRLRETGSDLVDRFIVVTGDDLNGAVRAFLDETGVPVLVKPFGPGDVRRALRARLGLA
jgi:two-component system response regulator MprA